MRFNFKVFWVGMCFSLSAFGSTEKLMDNSIFGFSYNYEKFIYQSVDKAILSNLKINSDRYWVFAKYNVKNGEQYIVIAGIDKIISDANPPVKDIFEPTFGIVVLIKEGKSSVIGDADNLFYEKMNVSEEIVDGLSNDALNQVIFVHGYDFFKNNIMKIDSDVLPKSLIRVIEKKTNSFNLK